MQASPLRASQDALAQVQSFPMSIRNLDSLFDPASVAVLGASDRPDSVGPTVWLNLKGGSFAGLLWPVNPRLDSLDGVPVCKNVAALPQAPELAVICSFLRLRENDVDLASRCADEAGGQARRLAGGRRTTVEAMTTVVRLHVATMSGNDQSDALREAALEFGLTFRFVSYMAHEQSSFGRAAVQITGVRPCQWSL